MITAILVVALVAAREAMRVRDRDAPAVRILGRMLVPASIGLAVVLAVRIAELAASHA